MPKAKNMAQSKKLEQASRKSLWRWRRRDFDENELLSRINHIANAKAMADSEMYPTIIYSHISVSPGCHNREQLRD